MSGRTLVTLFGCCVIFMLSQMPEGSINNLQTYTVKLRPSDLDAGVSITRYSGFGSSRAKCTSLIVTSRFTNPVVCLMDTGACLVTNASFPPFYDNSDGKPLHTCFTAMRFLIDKEEALASCGSNSNCCPRPFQSVNNVGCLFSSIWYSPSHPFSAARKACQSLWPSADLLVNPDSWPNLIDYLNNAGIKDPWLGATRNSVDSTWRWVDGTSVGGSHWGASTLILSHQPDGVGDPDDGLPANCGHLMKDGNLLGSRKMGDDACEHKRHYVCQIK